MAKRTDANQQQIVAALRKMGVRVWITSDFGRGAPDLVLGYRGRNYLIEIKDGSKPSSARKLTQDEEKFHSTWNGQLTVISSVDKAIAFIQGLITDPTIP